MNKYAITIEFDAESQRWYAHNGDIPISLEISIKT